MTRKKVSFFAVQYKNKPVEVKFYTKEGKPIKFEAVKKVEMHNRKKIEFYVKRNK